jgi:hypothetical protein
MSEVPRPTFILTAELDAESFAWLDGLRREHFPPERNVLSAHLTMFHRLSPEHVDRLLAVPIPARPIAIAFDGVTFLGFGNAIHARSGELELLRQKLKDDLRGGFSPQDGQRWSPHVTVQNKAPPEAARHVFEKLKRQVSPRSGDATGLLVWEYLGGPWRLAHRRSFEPG